MKKLYTTSEYKLWQLRKLKKFEKKRVKLTKNKKKKRPPNQRHYKVKYNLNDIVYAPADFRLIENTNECLLFIRDIRDESKLNILNNFHFVVISLEDVIEIDYGAISLLTAICEDLKFKNIMLRGYSPRNEKCKTFVEESDFLTRMYDEDGKRFPKAEKSDLIFFEKGQGALSLSANKKISQLVKHVVKHLSGESKYFLPVKTVLLEICGNSIEWSGTENKQWLLGVKYEDDKVIFTVTDVGKGILDTLFKRFQLKFKEYFAGKSNDEVLMGAFIKQYGSSTKEENRNKGLPSVKANFEQGLILNLIVLTNNVILDFNNNNSRTFEKGAARFKGTFYQWELTRDCIKRENN